MAEENKKVEQPTTTPATGGADVEFEIIKDQANAFFEKYRKLIFGVLAVVIIGGGGYYVYKTFIKGPKEVAAKEAIYTAQRYFELDSFQLALNGKEGSFSGFIDIIDEYSGTSSANAAYYYAGTCFLYSGNYDEAINFLSNYSSSDEYTQAMAYGMQGDAYSEKGEMDQAISFYEKAANYAPNESLAPYFLRKAGLLAEHSQKDDQAKGYYERIEKEYPLAADKLGIKKDLVRVTKTY